MAKNNTIVVNKDTLEPVNTGKANVPSTTVEPEVSKKQNLPLEPIENNVSDDVNKKDTFADKSAEAAAQAALASVAQVNKEVSMREAEKTYFQEKKEHMLKRCKSDNVVTRTVPKLYATYLGPVFTFMYNCIPVTVYCDDKPHKYPEFIAKVIDKKLLKIADSNTYKEEIEDRTEQDTY